VEGELPLKNPLLRSGTFYLRGGRGAVGDRMSHAGLALHQWAPFGRRWYLPRFQAGAAVTYHPVDRALVDPNGPDYRPWEKQVKDDGSYPFVFSPDKREPQKLAPGEKPPYPFVFSDQQKKVDYRFEDHSDETYVYNWPRWVAYDDPHWGLALESGLSLGTRNWQLGMRALYLRDDAMENSINGLPQGLSIVAATQFSY